MTEESSPYDEDIRTAYSVFAAKTDYDSFNTRFRSMSENKQARILRACNLYEKRTRQGPRDADVAMLLLCSSIEATLDQSSMVRFNQWLVRNKLDDLAMKDKEGIRRIIRDSYVEYENDPDREGASYNFRRVLLENCPSNFQRSPMHIYPRNETSREATFEESIRYIYAKFRSKFVHEGIGRLEQRPSMIVYIHSDLLDKYGSNHYSINMTQVLQWFSVVVVESLWNFFSTDENSAPAASHT